MQTLRGTKDILPEEIYHWQDIYYTVNKLLNIYNYHEIKTPILENTDLFLRSIGTETDIINKEMYTFEDQGQRSITLRPEGTASIARAYISNKMYEKSKINRLWYFGPMFRYERPQKGRQRQFNQLGIECLGTSSPIADIEVIKIANKVLETFGLKSYVIEINSIGNLEERTQYKDKLLNYLNQYKQDLDPDSQKRLISNPLRILDSKNLKTQNILINAPKIISCLNSESLKHFNTICEHLTYLNISYKINHRLVRGLDYYNYTAFEVKTNELGNQNTICGGGRYDKLIEQLGGPITPSVGWAIGIERLLLLATNNKIKKLSIYIIIQGTEKRQQIWDIIQIIEECKITFSLNITGNNLAKQLKQAHHSPAQICFIIGEEEIKNNYITIKWLKNSEQQKVKLSYLKAYLNTHKYLFTN
uniref:Histidine--tRNA ligase, chloroplastic n=1 Tax=Caloglossa beccarii TaxID=131038 RepID=A0A1Z1M8R7_9FLOR|nr:Histidine-tRNA ligase [Caloglossa beccarii]ARW62376.1 Histidine-tRNA ligase [Caloglossa beccarii]